jgi:hypothetical protein
MQHANSKTALEKISLTHAIITLKQREAHHTGYRTKHLNRCILLPFPTVPFVTVSMFAAMLR